jgi:hypothetical protein
MMVIVILSYLVRLDSKLYNNITIYITDRETFFSFNTIYNIINQVEVRKLILHMTYVQWKFRKSINALQSSYTKSL